MEQRQSHTRQSTPFVPTTMWDSSKRAMGGSERSYGSARSSSQALDGSSTRHSVKGSGDDLDDLLDMIDEIGPISPLKASKYSGQRINSDQESYKATGASSKNSSRTPRQRERCKFVQLAGMSQQCGVYSALSPCVCCNIRCTRCDMTVQIFDRSEWDPSCEYMFFRENHPNREKLSAMVCSNSNSRAFCCQCSWASYESDVERITPASEFRWVCGGH